MTTITQIQSMCVVADQFTPFVIGLVLGGLLVFGNQKGE